MISFPKELESKYYEHELKRLSNRMRKRDVGVGRLNATLGQIPESQRFPQRGASYDIAKRVGVSHATYERRRYCKRGQKTRRIF